MGRKTEGSEEKRDIKLDTINVEYICVWMCHGETHSQLLLVTKKK